MRAALGPYSSQALTELGFGLKFTEMFICECSLKLIEVLTEKRSIDLEGSVCFRVCR